MEGCVYSARQRNGHGHALCLHTARPSSRNKCSVAEKVTGSNNIWRKNCAHISIFCTLCHLHVMGQETLIKSCFLPTSMRTSVLTNQIQQKEFEVGGTIFESRNVRRLFRKGSIVLSEGSLPRISPSLV